MSWLYSEFIYAKQATVATRWGNMIISLSRLLVTNSCVTFLSMFSENAVAENLWGWICCTASSSGKMMSTKTMQKMKQRHKAKLHRTMFVGPFCTGMTNYPIGPHPTALDPIWPFVNGCVAQKTHMLTWHQSLTTTIYWNYIALMTPLQWSRPNNRLRPTDTVPLVVFITALSGISSVL